MGRERRGIELVRGRREGVGGVGVTVDGMGWRERKELKKERKRKRDTKKIFKHYISINLQYYKHHITVLTLLLLPIP